VNAEHCYGNGKKMRSLLEQLDSHEAVLLMYLAEELPADDQVEVEQRLAKDAGLRTELESLRALVDRTDGQLAALERCVPAESAWKAADAGRRVGAALMQMRSRQASVWTGQQREAPSWRFSWWCYSAAAAAAVLLVVIGWWGSLPHKPLATGMVAIVESPEQAEQRLNRSLRSTDGLESALASSSGREQDVFYFLSESDANSDANHQ